MSIEKLMNRTNENILLGIGENGGVFLFLSGHLYLLFISFFLFDRKP